ncbi:MAG: guanylate kinase, partial [Alphaproteobacteria bacterium]|nr:guanylate kinase [Alphaproteobacteria bacterium]
RIFVIAGPTNTGKDTIMKKLLQISDLNLTKIVTSTSRPPRPNEIDGVDYHFYSKDEFERKIKNNEFFEYALVHRDYKGIEKSAIYNDIPKDKDIILQVDIQGYKSLETKLDFSKYKLVGIFISPPSLDELSRRMKLRATETDPEDIKIRLKNAEFEIANKDIFDYQVVNDDLDTCVNEVVEIIRKNQL